MVARQSATARSRSSWATSAIDWVSPDVVVVGGVPGREPPEQVGGRDRVAQPGQAVGHRDDVLADAEDLLDEHDPGAVGHVGHRDVHPEGAVVDDHLIASHGHSASSSVTKSISCSTAPTSAGSRSA